jgi:hypothetical protein
MGYERTFKGGSIVWIAPHMGYIILGRLLEAEITSVLYVENLVGFGELDVDLVM